MRFEPEKIWIHMKASILPHPLHELINNAWMNRSFVPNSLSLPQVLWRQRILLQYNANSFKPAHGKISERWTIMDDSFINYRSPRQMELMKYLIWSMNVWCQRDYAAQLKKEGEVTFMLLMIIWWREWKLPHKLENSDGMWKLSSFIIIIKKHKIPSPSFSTGSNHLWHQDSHTSIKYFISHLSWGNL